MVDQVADMVVVPPLSEKENAFLDSVRSFVATEVLPNTREWESNTAFPDEIWTKLGDCGLLSMVVPPELGGPGLSCLAFVEACREIAKGDPALCMNVSAINALCLGHFVHFCDDEQRERYLADAMSGKLKLAWGLTEPDLPILSERPLKAVRSHPAWSKCHPGTRCSAPILACWAEAP